MRIDPYLSQLGEPLKQIAAQAAPREACGVITLTRQLVEVMNRSGDPFATFNAGPLHELEDQAGEFVALWHTHPNDEAPSPADLAGCRATYLPWVIAGPTKLFVIYPDAKPYSGVDFEYGTEDCWTRVTDWFAQEMHVFLPWFDRPADGWWETAGPSPYVDNAEAYGFKVMPFKECGLENLHVGDVILMKVAGKRTNHAAVYVGGGGMLHHLYGEISRVDQFCARWQGRATHVCRHKLLADLTARC